MFDANMCFLPRGKEFFAELRYVDENHPLYEYSKESKVIRCKMLSQERDNPSVIFYEGRNEWEISNKSCGTGTWIVYAGNLDGTGFINDKIKAEAMNINKNGVKP